MAGVLNVSVRRAAEMVLGPRLLGRKAPLEKCSGVVVADRLSTGELEISRGDVVACSGELGVVVACYEEGDGDAFGVLVDVAVIRRWLAPHSAVVCFSDRLTAWPIGQLVLCLAWKPIAGRDLLVVCQ